MNIYIHIVVIHKGVHIFRQRSTCLFIQCVSIQFRWFFFTAVVSPVEQRRTNTVAVASAIWKMNEQTKKL